MIPIPFLLPLLLLPLLLTGCGEAVMISTVPIGAGLAIIGLAMVIAAWIRSLFGGGE